MPEEVHARARLIAHYDDMIERLQRRIYTLQLDATGPEWTLRTAETIARYEIEIAITRKKVVYLQGAGRAPRRPGDIALA